MQGEVYSWVHVASAMAPHMTLSATLRTRQLSRIVSDLVVHDRCQASRPAQASRPTSSSSTE
jgi:hypothetical protein